MDPMDSQHVERFGEALEEWTDQRFVTREQIHDLAMFTVYLVNLAEGAGWTYDGHSLSLGNPTSRLVVRGTVKGVPSVVFTSGRTTMECIHVFMRKMKADLMEWTPDKFRA